MKLTKTERGIIMEMESPWEIPDIIDWIERGVTYTLENENIDASSDWAMFWYRIIEDMKVMLDSFDSLDWRV
mgnify:CR=1 FL=1